MTGVSLVHRATHKNKTIGEILISLKAMTSTSHYLGLRAGIGFVLLLAVSLAQQTRSQNTASQHANTSRRKEEKAAPPKKKESNGDEQASESGSVDASVYVGTEACKGCHEEEGNKFGANPHSKTLANKRPDKQGCEACHGPGESHSQAGDPENILRFESLSKPATAKICSDCHDLSKGAGHTLHEQHTKVGVSCLECHNIHNSRMSQHLLKSENSKLCLTCHAQKQ